MAPPGAIFFRAISLRLTPHCKFLYVHTPTTFKVTTLHFFVQKVLRVKNEMNTYAKSKHVPKSLFTVWTPYVFTSDGRISSGFPCLISKLIPRFIKFFFKSVTHSIRNCALRAAKNEVLKVIFRKTLLKKTGHILK